MDDFLYEAPRGKLHFPHCRDLAHKGSDFLSWERVSTASVEPWDPRLCQWCRTDLRRQRAALELAPRPSGPPSQQRSLEDYMRIGEQAVNGFHQVLDAWERIEPRVTKARMQLREWRAERAARKQSRLQQADAARLLHEADAEGVIDAEVVDLSASPDGEPPRPPVDQVR
jgi:hypothetical protein